MEHNKVAKSISKQNILKGKYKSGIESRVLFLRLLVVFGLLAVTSCSVSKSKYQKQYNLVWKEVIKSEAWSNALISTESTTLKEQDNFYTSTADVVLDNTENAPFLRSEDAFAKKYQDLVSKAYTKIIRQAENADARLKSEYNQYIGNGQGVILKKDKDYRQKLVLITKKYQAHQAMLEGLKSWNIFSENRSGDLDFFKAENENETFSMLLRGESEDRVINVLVYKLADLYHFEEQ